MTDREWLLKVWNAYNEYNKTVLYHERNLDHFIQWLYKQYGIIPPKN